MKEVQGSSFSLAFPPPQSSPSSPNSVPQMGFLTLGILFGLFLHHIVLNPFWQCDQDDQLFFTWVVVLLIYFQFWFLNEFPPLLFKVYNKAKVIYRRRVPSDRAHNEHFHLDHIGHFLVGWGFECIFFFIWRWINYQALCVRLQTCDQNKTIFFGTFFQIISLVVNSVPEGLRFLTRQVHWFLYYGVLRLFKFCYPQVFASFDVNDDGLLGVVPYNQVTHIHSSPPQPSTTSNIYKRTSQLSNAISPGRVPFQPDICTTPFESSSQFSIPSLPHVNHLFQRFFNVSTAITDADDNTTERPTSTRQEANAPLPYETTCYTSNTEAANGNEFSIASMKLSLPPSASPQESRHIDVMFRRHEGTTTQHQSTSSSLLTAAPSADFYSSTPDFQHSRVNNSENECLRDSTRPCPHAVENEITQGLGPASKSTKQCELCSPSQVRTQEVRGVGEGDSTLNNSGGILKRKKAKKNYKK